MIVISTLADMLREGYSLTAYCSNAACNQSRGLDLARLIERFGPDFKISDDRPMLLAALKCTKCGASAGEMTLHPPRSSQSPSGGQQRRQW